ncbi:MAG TPA: glycoside hydrolase family 25 protein [Pseudonocardia sp.]|uniref:glycoside hydrolase family 25 protein n=1 Tax=Pseudonocardia sp. TaxID=60912 RepID=UPI002CE2CB21|nr:glycoside hydrolase family 25 protein [Pseudonocardia sp.]HTF49424.1 glycoside hydrolase family 25 protein [Pseudonocardia sp.]
MAEPVAGIDVASWQGSPNWSKVAAAGFRFAYVKASEGNSTSYPTLNSQYAGARAAGLSVGLYHYAKVGQSATSNADALAAQVNRLGAKAGHLPPCLDLEEGSGNLAGWADTFIERLRARTGIRQVVVYSGAAFFTDHIGEGWMDPDIYLWIAHYGRPPGQPRYLTPRVAIHQHSQTGKVPGISGSCDLDVAIWPLEKLIVAATPKEDDVALSDADVRRIADAVLDTEINRAGDVPHQGQPTSLRGIVAWFDAVATHAPWDGQEAKDLAASVAAIRSKLQA